MSFRLFYWLAGICAFISITRILPIKALKPLFLQNPQPKTFLFWLVVAIVLAVIGWLVRNSERTTIAGTRGH